MGTQLQSIDQLLEELRQAGPNPDPRLLDRIRGLGTDAVPALVAMVTDPAEYAVAEDDEDDVSAWAPYPAVEILGELHPAEALQPLLSLITWDDYDYLTGVLPEALSRFGRSALDPLSSIVADVGRTVWTRGRAMEAMGKMALAFPELRDEIVERLTAQLDTDEPDNENLYILHGFLVGELVALHAEESIPSIIRAFEESRVDTMLIAWHHVREGLDLPPDVGAHLDQLYPKRAPILPLLSPASAPVGTSEPVGPPPGATRPAPPESYRRQAPKVGRNDPCPCGSGKKYKKCCGR